MIKPNDQDSNDYARLNPHRAVNWRQLRAQELAFAESGPARPQRHDDSHIRRYWRFLINLQHAAESIKIQLFNRQPGLFFAHQIYEGDIWTKCVVEARILARQDDAVIAGLLGTLPEVIEQYQLLFFNVRDRLDRRDFVLPILWREYESGADPDDRLDTMTRSQELVATKLLGYLGGPSVVDAMVSGGFTERTHVAPDKCQRWIKDAFAQMLRHKGAMAAFHSRVDRTNITQLCQLQREDQQHSTGGGSGREVDEFYEGLLKSFEQVPWKLMLRDDEASEAVKYFRTSAVEPRAREWMALDNDVLPASLLAADLNHQAPHDRKQGEEGTGGS